MKMIEEKLTGKFYHKKTWWGLVLMVEVTYKTHTYSGSFVTLEDVTEYRKAKESDLKKLNL